MRWAIASQRYSDSPDELVHNVRRALDLAPVALLTEVSGRARKAALMSMGGCIIVTGRGEGSGEAAVIVDRLARVLDSGTRRVTREHPRLPGRLRAPMHVSWAVVQRRGTGMVTLFVAGHPPARATTLLRTQRYRAVPPASVWLEFMRGTGELVEDVRYKHRGVEVVIGFDWNLDPRKPWARRLLLDELRQGGDVGQLTIAAPAVPTHEGGKVYDYAATSLDARVVDVRAQYGDHELVVMAGAPHTTV